MTRAFIGLGSNQGDPQRQLDRALELLGGVPKIDLIRCSPRYCTAPVGDPVQPDFLNAVAELETELAPLDLLRQLQKIELDLGRTRDPDRRWGPRTIDLDLLLFGDAVVRETDLFIPHSGIGCRAFVLRPLADLAPELEVPGQGRVSELLAGIDSSGVRPAQGEPPDKSDNGAS